MREGASQQLRAPSALLLASQLGLLLCCVGGQAEDLEQGNIFAFPFSLTDRQGYKLNTRTPAGFLQKESA